MQPPINDAAASEPASSSRSALKVLGPSGIFLAPARPWFDRVYHLFPARAVRVWALLGLLTAIGVTAAWLTITIENKWMRDIHNPTTTLTTENVMQIPALHGELMFFHPTLWINQTLANTLTSADTVATQNVPLGWGINPRTPFPSYTVPAPIPDDYLYAGYSWHEVYLQSQKVSWDQSLNHPSTFQYGCISNPGVQPNPFQLEICVPRGFNSLVDGTNTAPWPLLLNSTQDQVCVRSYRLLDRRAFVEIDARVGNLTNPLLLSFNQLRYSAPFVWMSLMDLAELRKSRANGYAPTQDSPTQLFSAMMPLIYNQHHTLRMTMSQHVDLAGAASWKTELQFGGSQAFNNPQLIADAFDDYFAGAPEFHATLLRDPNLQLDQSKPNATQLYYMETCFTPASFGISTIRESRVYGAFNFLSDLGGFLSLMALAFAFAFPFSEVLIKPHTFIGLWLWKKACGNNDKDAELKTNLELVSDAAKQSSYQQLLLHS